MGVVMSGLNRPIPATLGSFSIGSPTARSAGPAHEPEPVPAQLRLRRSDRRAARRPDGSHPYNRGRGAAYGPRAEAPGAACATAAHPRDGVYRLEVSTSFQAYFLDTLVKVAIVITLYVFIGGSGVLSFGTISFVALGAWTAGVLTVRRNQKRSTMPASPTSSSRRTRQRRLACARRSSWRRFALVVGLPLMRLLRPLRRDRHLGRARITYNVSRTRRRSGRD